MICNVNAIANTVGKGRDDFDFKILQKAELILKSNYKSKAVQNLAAQVRTSFNAYRLLMHKYSINIEIVDPQLKNNKDLVNVLQKFEETWSLAKDFFLQDDRIAELDWFA